ncbi:MAG: D-aminoacyl-tRNA deacylase [Candidatus Thermoplasmatota archaeon]|nr:D-aminoacyl-tRNA deacylase [Candidatus Thermoplasmatota archaeon]
MAGESVIADIVGEVCVKIIVTSSEDNASMNIRSRLLERSGWLEGGMFEEHPILRRDDFAMVQVDRIHLDEDNIDERVSKVLGCETDVVIFASRHKAASKIPTLTVHPIGNYSSADFGGKSGTLCRSHPGFMTSALRCLSREAQGMGFDVSFETTHHGPLLLTAPAFYIEIGSYEELWGREDAAEAIATSILSVSDDGYPSVIGVGGGHYAPRYTDIALSRKVSIGHMAANYALDSLSDEMILQMAQKSDDAKIVYFHKKSMSKPIYRGLSERFAALGIREVRSEEFEPL